MQAAQTAEALGEVHLHQGETEQVSVSREEGLLNALATEVRKLNEQLLAEKKARVESEKYLFKLLEEMTGELQMEVIYGSGYGPVYGSGYGPV